MKECELCDRAARMYCESDQASLCWDCDTKVHGANFLVARHSRSLLCRSCQSPTTWKATGHRIGAAVSVCERCEGGKPERGGGDEEDEEGEEEEDDEDDEEEEEEGEEEEEEGDGEEEDGEYQVVPATSSTPPPSASSSSSEEESTSRTRGGFLKRMRENADLASQEDHACYSFQPSHVALEPAATRITADDEATSFDARPFRPSKDRKKAIHIRSASTQLAGSSKRFHHETPESATDDSAAAILDICNRGVP